MRRLLGRALVASVVGLIATGMLAVPPAAAANLRLISTDPVAGTQVAAPPQRITMVFDAEPSTEATTVSVLGPRGQNASGGDVRVDGKTVTIGFRPPVVGPYTVAWGTLAPDGDPIGDAFSFTLTGLTPAPASPSATPATPDVPESGPNSGEPVGSGVDGRSEQRTPWWPYAVGAVLVLALLVGGGRYAYRKIRR
jgi:methionine-rich copper-binding protein CopC